ncbi:MAG: tRNA (adenosine(37)-N6)-dimethylallyltransferase MiaA [Patescibacteria group bacterium]
MSLIVITGQTATGKTTLAVDMAKKCNGELVNFDSRQIYRHLDIITGKDLPPSEIHLYDIVTPDKYFSSYDYVVKARPVIEEIRGRGKTPILVGGTYLYLKHLLYDFDVQAPPDFDLRKVLNKKTVPELQEKLMELSRTEMDTMNNSDRNNPRRLIRRIEILSKVSKVSKGQSFRRTDLIKLNENYKSNKLGVTSFIGIKYKDKEKLIEAIKIRVSKRVEAGAVAEVQKLLRMGYGENDPGMKTIGYQEIIKYLKGVISYEHAVEQWINHEVQYAKRQYTFMKKDINISWREI